MNSKKAGTAGLTSYFTNRLKVRTKINLGFLLVIVIFLAGFLVVFDATQTIGNTNIEILDKFSVIQAKSLELELNFEQQVALIETYTIGAENVTKQDFIDIGLFIDEDIEILRPLLEEEAEHGHPEGLADLDKIVVERVLWDNVALNGLFNLPSQKILEEFLFFTEELEFLVAELTVFALHYMITGDPADKVIIASLRTNITQEITEVEHEESLVLAVNVSIHALYRGFIDAFEADYETWNTEIITDALAVGDNFTTIVAAGDQYLWTNWVAANGTAFEVVEDDLKQLVTVLLLHEKNTIDLEHRGTEILTPLIADLEDLRLFAEEEMAAEKVISTAAINNAFIATIGSVALGIIIAVLIGIFVSTSISKPLGDMSTNTELLANKDLRFDTDEVDTDRVDEIGVLNKHFIVMVETIRNMISEITEAASVLGSSSEQLAASTEEVNSSSEEIASIAQEMSRGSQEQTVKVNESLNQADTLAEVFAEKINDIEKASQIIEQITNQVNMLSLNASIEAARAGEYGRGFGVVADNIRGLADETKSSVVEVNTIISELKSAVTQSISNIRNSIQDVVSVSEETAAGAEEATAATEEQTATMQEMSSSAQELAKVAVNLQTLIGSFKLSKTK